MQLISATNENSFSVVTRGFMVHQLAMTTFNQLLHQFDQFAIIACATRTPVVLKRFEWSLGGGIPPDEAKDERGRCPEAIVPSDQSSGQRRHVGSVVILGNETTQAYFILSDQTFISICRKVCEQRFNTYGRMLYMYSIEKRDLVELQINCSLNSKAFARNFN